MDHGANCEPGAEYTAQSQAQGWAGFCDPTLAFRRPELATMAALWRQVAGDAPVPKRADISPRTLKDHLPNVVIYERVIVEGVRRYRVRLMGSQFAQTMGDLTGKFIDTALPAEFLPRWYAALDAVLDCGLPLRFVSRSDTANKAFLVGEFFEAPLLSDGGSMNLVIAAGIFTPAENWPSFLADVANTAEMERVAV
jgi:hypothetical protein